MRNVNLAPDLKSPGCVDKLDEKPATPLRPLPKQGKNLLENLTNLKSTNNLVEQLPNLKSTNNQPIWTQQPTRCKSLPEPTVKWTALLAPLCLMSISQTWLSSWNPSQSNFHWHPLTSIHYALTSIQSIPSSSIHICSLAAKYNFTPHLSTVTIIVIQASFIHNSPPSLWSSSIRL